MTHIKELEKIKGAIIFDPCHSFAYDASGRPLNAEQSPLSPGNLKVPPYYLEDQDTVVIGVQDWDSLPELANPRDQYSQLPPTEKLLAAALFDDLDTVREAVRQSADVNASRITAFSESLPLTRAILSSSVDMINFLLSKGAVPNEHSLRAARISKRPEIEKLIQDLVQSQ